MKKQVLIIAVILGTAQFAFSQKKQNDTIPYADPASKVQDFSQRKEVNRDVLYYSHLYDKKSTIVIINKKIYNIDSAEFRSLSKDKIAQIDIITDEKSETPIKKIIYITTK